MISVEVFINNKRIVSRYAVRQDRQDEQGRTVYRMDDGTEILHHRKHGAHELARLMLAADLAREKMQQLLQVLGVDPSDRRQAVKGGIS